MKKQVLSAACVLLAAVLWGCMGIFVRYFNGLGISAMNVTLVRMSTAVVVLPVVAAVWKPALFRVRLRDLWCFAGAGILSVALLTVAYFKTISLTTMSAAAVLLYFAPSVVVLLSAVLFREKITVIKALAVVLAFAGCVLVSEPWGSRVPLAAVGTGLTSAVAYALYSVFAHYATERGYHSLTIVLYSFWFSIIGILPFSQPLAVARTLNAAGWRGWCMMLLMGLLTAVLPYLFYTISLAGLETGKASVMASLEPVAATVAGALAFREWPSAVAACGIVLVLAGVVLLNVRFKKV